MDLSFYPLTLEAFDQANAEALCLFVGEDERPLVGLSGLCDWRMSGGLSRMLRKGLVKGEEGEALLTPGLRLGFRKLFLFGMGPVGQNEEELASRLAERLRRLGRAGVEDAAFQIPQRISLDVGIRTLVEEPNGPTRARVFAADPAAMVRALSHAASRGASEARHERRVIKVPPSHKAPPQPVRTGQPVRQGLIEIPKASQLPFAPMQSSLAAALTPAPPIAIPSATTATPDIRTSAAPSTSAAASNAGSSTGAAPSSSATNAGEGTAASLADDATPIAPSASNPPDLDVPIAPPAEPTPLPPVSPDQVAALLAKPPPEPSRVPPKNSLPVDYKAPRFVPPEPKPEPSGGKKKNKRRR